MRMGVGWMVLIRFAGAGEGSPGLGLYREGCLLLAIGYVKRPWGWGRSPPLAAPAGLCLPWLWAEGRPMCRGV